MKSTTFVFAAGVLAALSTQGVVADEPEQYIIKQSVPALGTNLKRPIMITGTIPLDKTYAELTPAQQNSIKALYEKMGAGDEPPFPIHGLRPLYSALAQTHENLELAYKGPLTMYVQVDSQGVPGALYLVEAPDPQLGQAAANILALQKFKPALCNGTPCSMRYVFHAEFLSPEVHNVKANNPGVVVTPHWPPGG